MKISVFFTFYLNFSIYVDGLSVQNAFLINPYYSDWCNTFAPIREAIFKKDRTAELSDQVQKLTESGKHDKRSNASATNCNKQGEERQWMRKRKKEWERERDKCKSVKWKIARTASVEIGYNSARTKVPSIVVTSRETRDAISLQDRLFFCLGRDIIASYTPHFVFYSRMYIRT